MWQNHDKIYAINTLVFSYNNVLNCSNIPGIGHGLRGQKAF